MKVLETEIPKGKESVVYLKVANLPTRTEIDIPVFIGRTSQGLVFYYQLECTVMKLMALRLFAAY